VNEEIIKSSLFEPAEENVVLLCGPPAMIQKAALPALKGMLRRIAYLNYAMARSGTDDDIDWGYKEDKNCFGFWLQRRLLMSKQYVQWSRMVELDKADLRESANGKRVRRPLRPPQRLPAPRPYETSGLSDKWRPAALLCHCIPDNVVG
jgi:hypothetical protein